MWTFEAKQLCSGCGAEFSLMYYRDNGSYSYISDPCECEDSFTPSQGVPSLSQWMEHMEHSSLLPETIAEFVLRKDHISLVPGMISITYQDRYGNAYKAFSERTESLDQDEDCIIIHFSSPGCEDDVEAVEQIEEALLALTAYCTTHHAA